MAAIKLFRVLVYDATLQSCETKRLRRIVFALFVYVLLDVLASMLLGHALPHVTQTLMVI